MVNSIRDIQMGINNLFPEFSSEQNKYVAENIVRLALEQGMEWGDNWDDFLNTIEYRQMTKWAEDVKVKETSSDHQSA